MKDLLLFNRNEKYILCLRFTLISRCFERIVLMGIVRRVADRPNQIYHRNDFSLVRI